MCIVGVASGRSERFPLVIAANRDELFSREAAPLSWWAPSDASPPILAGRDLQAGGTWLGASPNGRIALVTNVREPVTTSDRAPSRGEIVGHWLRGEASLDALERHVLDAGFAGVNVLAFEGTSGAHVSNRGRSKTLLTPGIHGLSNATIDTPWPKVTTLDARLEAALSSPLSREQLTEALFAALRDEKTAPDSALPSTGVPPAIERALSSVFIRAPSMAYGTRCSSVLVLDDGVLHFVERTFGPDGSARFDRTHTIE